MYSGKLSAILPMLWFCEDPDVEDVDGWERMWRRYCKYAAGPPEACFDGLVAERMNVGDC